MRLHRDADPSAGEPDDGWVEGTGESPSGPLSGLLGNWSVVRHWRDIGAPTAAEAIAVAKTGHVKHDDARASRAPLTMLYLAKDELAVMLTSISASIIQTETNLRFASSEPVRAALRYNWQMLNSLRTAVAEARYGLMSREEIDAEKEALDEAQRAGIIADLNGPGEPHRG